MKKIYGYIRVSTPKQGKGVSLEVQKSDIENFIKNKNITILEWIIEKKSASKRYRPKFDHMIERLSDNQADGFIAHKIDRMSRNRFDWAMVNDMADMGHIVLSADGTTLADINGRFMGDIQAAVATRYSSNLSLEAKKGLYGQLNNGIYPFLAPLGYINNGGNKVKTIDPIKAPLIKQLFELYTKKGFTVRKLVIEMYERGLRNTRGNKVPKNSILKILKNPYYAGIMKVRGQHFKGKHKTLITMRVHKKAQDIMSGKTNTKIRKHNFLYRKMINCKNCNYKLIGELQKGNIYYRCHTKGCPTKSMRENTIDYYVNNLLKSITISKEEVSTMEDKLMQTRKEWLRNQKNLLHSIKFRIAPLDTKLEKITDLLINGIFSKEEYENEKQKILARKQELNEEQNEVSTKKTKFLNKMQEFLELAKKPALLYDLANIEEKRSLLENLTSNFQIDGKRVVFSMVSSFYDLANRDVLMSCRHDNTTNLQKERTIIYANTNTSAILLTPLDDKLCEEFFDYLLEQTASLPVLNLPTNNEIQTNHPTTQ